MAKNNMLTFIINIQKKNAAKGRRHELHENLLSCFTPFLQEKNDIFIGQVWVAARQAGTPLLEGNPCPG
jgi:hypothetical protein